MNFCKKIFLIVLQDMSQGAQEVLKLTVAIVDLKAQEILKVEAFFKISAIHVLMHVHLSR